MIKPDLSIYDGIMGNVFLFWNSKRISRSSRLQVRAKLKNIGGKGIKLLNRVTVLEFQNFKTNWIGHNSDWF